ncbi:hypothetical protein CspeluHIS016_0301300 [Cutaneotrichosporon spelunceum]|uniref:MFS general substrate transporter n=1 Tax=Cutaneotrichosporon spelunceum TaxID=1672016 RepID=A0AAD3TTR3_9TREE|nr:hypothetical protein CspeluHIS016_0301300 [Cutaneotrichosporon spelunceum]
MSMSIDEEKELGGASPTGQHKSPTISANGNPDLVEIDWDEGDPQNPYNWTLSRKWLTLTACALITITTIANATSQSIMATWGPDWFHCSRLTFILGLCLYNLAVAVTPMFLAPLSEHLGRNVIYQVSGWIVALLFLPQALSHNIHGYLAARWFQGMASSVGNSMVGGTIADMFGYKERGQLMNFFTLTVFVGQGLGGLTMGWTGQLVGLQWCFGAQGIASAVSGIFSLLFLRETRGNIILRRRAKRMTNETGLLHMSKYDLTSTHKSTAQQLTKSVGLPLKMLLTEPIVIALTLWIGFAWAIIFLGGTSTILVFEQYGFSPGESGSIQSCIGIGGIMGYLTSFHQEHLFHKAAARSPTGRASPEARLYWAAIGGLIFPSATLAFGWTGRPPIHWAVPAFFLCLSYWGIFSMYLGTFNYVADAYEQNSSSAQAAHSMVRNGFSGIFPLFARQMYVKMGYPQASSLIAGLGFALAIAPFMLIKYGARLRAKSPITTKLVGQI